MESQPETPNGHAVLVTGGGGGIGGAVARRLAREGLLVLVAGRNQERLTAVVSAIREEGGRASDLIMDVADRASIQRGLSEARELAAEHGPIDGLVNNAGMAVSAPLLASESEDGGPDLFERHLSVNFHGPRLLVEALLPDMKGEGFGRIVNVISSAGLRGYPYVAAYCASKHALLGYTRAAAEELVDSGITIAAVCPHYVDSPLIEATVRRIRDKTRKSEEEVRSFLADQNPGGRMVTVQEVADAVWSLWNPGAGGRVVELDGTDEPILHAAIGRGA